MRNSNIGYNLMKLKEKYNKALQLTNNTPLRSVLWSTEFKRYIFSKH